MIVLDTHVWVWVVSNPEEFSRTAREAVEAALEKRAVFISSISAWEVALLVSKERVMKMYIKISKSRFRIFEICKANITVLQHP